VVIGGGIQGAGIALVAVKSGYSVLLLEKNTWASGTSSKSSKLIHGGLRYLQTGQFKLVYECLAERQWMLEQMPDLVKPNWFYIPIYKESPYPVWKIHCGLWLYRLLSGRGRYSQYKKIPHAQWQTLSGLRQDNLKAVFAYQDAQTDDAALTQAVVQRVQALGGDCFEQTECLAADNNGAGYDLHCKQGDVLSSTSGSIIVNATGPWANQLLQRLRPKAKALAIDLVQGSHLVIRPQLSERCFYLQAPQDKRAVFCLPWKGQTLVGTTEVMHHGEPETAAITETEKQYLSEVVRYYFPHYVFTIASNFCGLRVLPATDNNAFSRPRDTIIQQNEKIISLYGGKLTAWRATAIKVLVLINTLSGRKGTINPDTIMTIKKG
jgi:glycerol-3-phosphate dehydrogenase